MNLKLTFFLSILLLVNESTPFAQDDEFVIGVFGYSPKKAWDDDCLNNVYLSTKFDDDGWNSSPLNVYVEDGVNVVQEYAPHEWSLLESERNRFLCAIANGVKISVGGGHYYRPTFTSNVSPFGWISAGVNEYDNCGNPIDDCTSPVANGHFRTSISRYIDEIYSQAPFKDAIWGYHISEEAEHYHATLKTLDCSLSDFTNWGHCESLSEGGNDDFWKLEVPPSNVVHAMNYYLNKLAAEGITDHKVVVMPANHKGMINDNTTDPEGQYESQDYVNAVTDIPQAVVLEGGYTQFPSSFYGGDKWYNHVYNNMLTGSDHFLGTFKSLHYIKGKGIKAHEVVATYVNEAGGYAPNLEGHYHTNPNIKNANWLWFQVYTSIIHGAEGVWFWGNGGSWGSGEPNNWINDSMEDRFQRDKFPDNYKTFISNLIRELRYLKEQGFLSTDPESEIYTKSDHADLHCIVPAADTYIPDRYTDPVTQDQINLTGSVFSSRDNFQTEAHGLRYTIRSNGEQMVMILTNPLPITYEDINLNFSQIPDKKIRDASGAWVLFENPQDPNSTSYKTNRNSGVDWSAGTVSNKHFVSMVSEELTVDIGPCDTKILLFQTNDPYANSDGKWTKKFTNEFTGNLGGWTLGDIDMYYTGDFDGNGKEELLIAHTVNTNPWMTTLEYNYGKWEWKWSNYGESHALTPYRFDLIVGDFDGDGDDDILGNDQSGWTTMFKFLSNDFVWAWSDNGSHGIQPYKDNLIAGDFNGDGKDEVLGIDYTGWMTVWHFNGLDDFTWGWSNYGAAHALEPYKYDLRAGDFDGDGKDELLGQASWGTLFRFDGSDFVWMWSTYGSSSFAGWSFPLAPSDHLVIGDFSNNKKDELLFFQDQTGGHWSTLMTLDFNSTEGYHWDWLWTANNSYAEPYLNDWPILAPTFANSTGYVAIKARKKKSDHLLALREFKACQSTRYLANLYYYPDESIQPGTPIGGPKGPQIVVVPNPTTGLIRVRVDGMQVLDGIIEIYSSTGQKVFEQRNYVAGTELDISHLQKGIYVLKLTSKNEVMTERVVIS